MAPFTMGFVSATGVPLCRRRMKVDMAFHIAFCIPKLDKLQFLMCNKSVGEQRQK